MIRPCAAHNNDFYARFGYEKETLGGFPLMGGQFFVAAVQDPLWAGGLILLQKLDLTATKCVEIP